MNCLSVGAPKHSFALMQSRVFFPRSAFPPHQIFCPWQCPSDLQTAWSLLSRPFPRAVLHHGSVTLHIPRSLKSGRSQQHPPSLSSRSGTSWWASSASLCSAFSVLAFLLTGDSKVKGELGVEQLSLEETPGVFVLSLLEGKGHE